MAANLGAGYITAAMRDDRLYTMGRMSTTNAVYCLDAAAGKVVRRFSFESVSDPNSTATVDGDYPYALSSDGIVFYLKSKNGKQVWRKSIVNDNKAKKIPFHFSVAPITSGDSIILIVNTSGIALSKNSGNLLWASAVQTVGVSEQRYHATPAILSRNGNKRALILSGTGLYSVDTVTGQTSWCYKRYQKNYCPIIDPILHGNRVPISTYSGTIDPP